MFERPKTSDIPTKPGAYMFRDRHGKVIYVGKAKSLRSRVASYFGAGLHPRTQVPVSLLLSAPIPVLRLPTSDSAAFPTELSFQGLY